jgi:hypothetical protein
MATRPVRATSRNAAGLSCTLSAGASADCTPLPVFGTGAYASGIVLLLKETGVIV